MSRRWRNPRGRRGEFFGIPWPVTAPQPPPALAPRVTRGRARLGVTVRRGRFVFVPLVAAPSPAAFIPAAVRQPAEYRLGLRAWRRAFLTVPAATSSVPSVQRGAATHSPALRLRRGRFAAPPPEILPPSRQVARSRVRLAAIREGRFVATPLPIAVTPPPPWPPRSVRGLVRLAALRRAEFTCPPWQVQATPPPPWAPPFTAGRRKPPATRRGRITTCPPQTSSVPPPLTGHRASPRPRRGVTTSPPWTSHPPIGRATGRRRPAAGARAGRFTSPGWPQAAPPAPPTRIPILLKGRRGVPALRVHGRMMPGWMPLTTSPVVNVPAILSSASAPVADLTASSSLTAAMASSDSPVTSIGGD